MKMFPKEYLSSLLKFLAVNFMILMANVKKRCEGLCFIMSDTLAFTTCSKSPLH